MILHSAHYVDQFPYYRLQFYAISISGIKPNTLESIPMKIRTIPLQWYSDPGHSWLRVSRKDADHLGILNRISAFSYQSESNRILYLEEDCDAPILLDALSKSTDSLPNYRIDRHTNKRSRVKSLLSYNSLAISEIKP